MIRDGAGTRDDGGRGAARQGAWLLVLALLLLLPMTGEVFFVRFGARVLVYALAAMSLDLILGYGGMVSFGHAAFIGIGAYTVGILALNGVESAFISWPAAIACAGLAAAVIGALSLRARGMYFIMITLAFSQMLFYTGSALHQYGGDEGRRMPARNSLAGFLDLQSETAFYYLTLAVFIGCLWFARRLVASRFGMVLHAIRQNETRALSVGIPAYRYKLTAFVISGALGGLAGALLANLNTYFAPAYFEWYLSGDLIAMVVLGGIASLVGPAIGAFTFLVFQELLSRYFEHWQVIFGPLLVLVVLFANRGIYGWFAGGAQAKPARRPAAVSPRPELDAGA